MIALWWLVNNWRLLAGGALFVGVVALYMLWQSAAGEAERNAIRLETLRDAHNVTLSSLDRLESDIEASRQAVSRVQAREREARERARNLQRMIDNAPENGCVGPAVRGVLDGLRPSDGDSR